MAVFEEVERERSASGRAVETTVDAGLIERAKGMDEEAWARIVDLHYDRLCHYLRNRTQNAAAAEDLASQVFTEAVARIGTYQWRGLPFAAWLFRIARNLGTDYYRKHTLREGGPLIDAAVEAEELGHLERDDEHGEVRQALAMLTDEQRQVLELRFVAECSIAETAATLQKTEGAIKAIQHRGLASMRRALEQIDPHTWRRDHGNAHR